MKIAIEIGKVLALTAIAVGAQIVGIRSTDKIMNILNNL